MKGFTTKLRSFLRDAVVLSACGIGLVAAIAALPVIKHAHTPVERFDGYLILALGLLALAAGLVAADQMSTALQALHAEAEAWQERENLRHIDTPKDYALRVLQQEKEAEQAYYAQHQLRA